ncbi:hypothetical protein P7C71_g544, partial [Lecanoromycetidae sp. Uapishka_2]
MDTLPAELILHISLFLDARDIIPLQLVSKHFLTITRDNGLWKELCFNDSHSEAARTRRHFLSATSLPVQEPRVFELQRAVARSTNSNGDIKSTLQKAYLNSKSIAGRAIASWDPTYPGEKVDWYREYIARDAPLSVSWLQQPHHTVNGSREKLETRGLGLSKNRGDDHVVAPLDDGSVCIWQLGQDDAIPQSSDGRIIARSRPNLLSANGPDGGPVPARSRARMISTGVVECVSVDQARNKAYFAAQSGLNEIDLSTLQISSYDRYPFSISALSESTYPVPLTVGTTLSLHIHDPRQSNNARLSSYSFATDRVEIDPHLPSSSDFYRIASGDSSQTDYATLFHPSPLSILHHNPSSMIYVAGRYPSILTYDRRSFPKLTSAIHSGARLCSLASLPTPEYPTVAAAGEYNGKGSLELYPLPTSTSIAPSENGREPTHNRTSASRSKLLSLTTHGARLLFSDSDGQLKSVERDGSTLVRRWNINTYSTVPDNLAATQGIFNNDLNEGDVARKLVPVSEKENSEVLLWTGEKIGVLGFRKNPRFMFDQEGEDNVVGTDAEKGAAMEEKEYGRMMKRALEKQANEVRFVRGLGLRHG